MQLRPPLLSQKLCCIIGDGFPLTILVPFQAENQTWVNQFLGFCIRQNIFLDKMDIGISGGKNKNIFVEFFSTFLKITVGGFVNQFI